MSVKGVKVTAKNSIQNSVKKGQDYLITSTAKDWCVLDGKIIIKISDLNENFSFHSKMASRELSAQNY